MALLSKRHRLVDIGHILQTLLENGADVNFNGVKFECALEVRSFRGKDDLMQLLLTNEADVDIQGGIHGCAIQAASYVS